MPELPEVETVVRGLRAPLVGRTITGLWTDWPKALRPHTPDDFAALLTGQTVHAITRRAKYILCQIDDGLLAIHLKMTGRLYISGAPESGDRWVHVRFTLDNGQYLHFSDARRFGRVYLAPTLDDFAPGLGPEPLEDDFTPAVLRERLPGATVGLFGDRVHVATAHPAAAGRTARELIAAAGFELHSIRPIPPSLEDVFVSVLAREDPPS